MYERSSTFYRVNPITLYRLISAPVALGLVMLHYTEAFRLLIVFSFFTHAIDGPLSRYFKVPGILGARLDSLADDATVLVSSVALWILFPQFVLEHGFIIGLLLALFLTQGVVALSAYNRLTSFHTNLAKIAAIAQATFFVFIFFGLPGVGTMFFIAGAVTGLQRIEEIVLVILLLDWQTDVKGLYWGC